MKNQIPKCIQNKQLKSNCCIDQNCSQNPFICNDQYCKCHQIHKFCLTKDWNYLTQQLQATKLKQEVLFQLNQLYQSFQITLQKIQNLKKEFTKIISPSENKVKFYDKIESHQYNQINGQFLHLIQAQQKIKLKPLVSLYDDIKYDLEKSIQKKRLYNLQQFFSPIINQSNKPQQNIQKKDNRKQEKLQGETNTIVYVLILLISIFGCFYYLNYHISSLQTKFIDRDIELRPGTINLKELNNTDKLNQIMIGIILQLKQNWKKIQISQQISNKRLQNMQDNIKEIFRKVEAGIIKNLQNLIHKKYSEILNHKLKINGVDSLLIRSQIQKQRYLTQIQQNYIQFKKNCLEKIKQYQGKVIADLKNNVQQLVGYQFNQLADNIEKELKELSIKFQENAQKNNILINAIEGLGFFDKKIKSINTCYKASENNFQANKFHENCDGKKNTMTVLKTEFGNIIGGYTPLPWNKNSRGYQTDSMRQSFLFSLTNKHKLNLIAGQQQYAIYHIGDCGPTFGGLSISDQANKNPDSFADPGNIYNNGEYASDKQQSYQKFSGQTNGYEFKVSQWQVHEIVFQ